MLQKQTVEPRTLDILKQCMSLKCLESIALVDGTALSLQYGHRTSIDLGFFGDVAFLNEEEITKQFIKIVPTFLANKSQVMLGYFIKDLKIDVVKYKYPLLVDPIIEEGIRMARPEDIAAMNFAAISGRGKKNDFTDLYYLLKHFSFSQLFDFYSEKCSDGNPMIVLRCISYFEDAEVDQDPLFTDKQISWAKNKAEIINKLHIYLYK